MDTKSADQKSLNGLLFAAITQGSVSAVQSALDRGADPNATAMGAGLTQLSALQHTIQHTMKYKNVSGARRLDIIRRLLAAGADPNFIPPLPHRHHQTPLAIALLKGESRCALALLEGGARPDTLISSYAPSFSALHQASARGMISVVRALMALGVDPNISTIHGNTPAHSAALGGHIATLAALVSAGALLTHKNSEGKTPEECIHQGVYADYEAWRAQATRKMLLSLCEDDENSLSLSSTTPA